MMRVGIGYDVHRLVKGRRLVLGGLEIPSDCGLEGHSDGDVVVHALMDALLGAAALGDIGVHFPPSDPQYKGISSLVLLQRVGQILTSEGWRVENIDVSIVAERPLLAPFIPQMKERMGQALGVNNERVGVKATTSEGLGFAGRGEGMAVYAVALLNNQK